MLQHAGICIAIVCAGIACSSSLRKAPLLTKQVFDRGSEPDGSTSESQAQNAPSSGDATAPVPMPPMPVEEKKVADETVSPPGNISGSYLICIEANAPTSAVPESTVNCAVRDQKTNNKVGLKAQFSNVQWTYQLANIDSLTILHSETSSSPEWHVSIMLKAPSLEQVQAQRNAIKFVVSVQDNAGVKRQEVAPVSVGFLRWLPLDGARVPTNAAVGGTEDDGAETLFLCRLYMGAEIIPGKMIVHFNDPSKSICYSSLNGTALASHTDDARTMLFRSDVLVVNEGTFDEYFEWIPASSGLKPAQALISGVDTLGNPLYACRGLQAAGSIQEQTPGVLRPGAPGCAHEYYGVNTSTNYQVLAWKETATKKIMDGRAILPP